MEILFLTLDLITILTRNIKHLRIFIIREVVRAIKYTKHSSEIRMEMVGMEILCY